MNRRHLFGLLAGYIGARWSGSLASSAAARPEVPIMLAETKSVAWLKRNFGPARAGEYRYKIWFVDRDGFLVEHPDRSPRCVERA